MHGLRRALVVAGAETQVMSLWQVDDQGTRDLMTAYYETLFAQGLGRGEALQKAQLAMLARPEYKHPFFWASFISSGATGPIEGAGRGRPSRDSHSATIPRGGAQGCGCSTGGETMLDGSLSVWLSVGIAFAARVRRRRL
ncbi:MAG: CHAT domain-containing protein [Minicystis sp.]